jgi:hypothetical protein
MSDVDRRGFLQMGLAALGMARTGEKPFRPERDRHGILDLPASQARLRGERLKLEAQGAYLTGWSDPREWVEWTFELPKAGRFQVVLEYAAESGLEGAEYRLRAGEQVREGRVESTGGADRFLPQPLPEPLRFSQGTNRVELRALSAPRGQVMNMKRLRLVPEREGD